MKIKERKELLRKLALPFYARDIYRFLNMIQNFSPADLEQLEYGIRLIQEQEQKSK